MVEFGVEIIINDIIVECVEKVVIELCDSGFVVYVVVFNVIDYDVVNDVII